MQVTLGFAHSFHQAVLLETPMTAGDYDSLIKVEQKFLKCVDDWTSALHKEDLVLAKMILKYFAGLEQRLCPEQDAQKRAQYSRRKSRAAASPIDEVISAEMPVNDLPDLRDCEIFGAILERGNAPVVDGQMPQGQSSGSVHDVGVGAVDEGHSNELDYYADDEPCGEKEGERDQEEEAYEEEEDDNKEGEHDHSDIEETTSWLHYRKQRPCGPFLGAMPPGIRSAATARTWQVTTEEVVSAESADDTTSCCTDWAIPNDGRSEIHFRGDAEDSEYFPEDEAMDADEDELYPRLGRGKKRKRPDHRNQAWVSRKKRMSKARGGVSSVAIQKRPSSFVSLFKGEGSLLLRVKLEPALLALLGA